MDKIGVKGPKTELCINRRNSMSNGIVSFLFPYINGACSL